MPDPPTLEPIDESVFAPRPEDKIFRTPGSYLKAGLLVDSLILLCAALVISSYVQSFDQYYRGECGFLGGSHHCTLEEYRRMHTVLIWLVISPLSLLLILPPLVGYYVGKRKLRKEAA